MLRPLVVPYSRISILLATTFMLMKHSSAIEAPSFGCGRRLRNVIAGCPAPRALCSAIQCFAGLPRTSQLKPSAWGDYGDAKRSTQWEHVSPWNAFFIISGWYMPSFCFRWRVSASFLFAHQKLAADVIYFVADLNTFYLRDADALVVRFKTVSPNFGCDEWYVTSPQ